MYICEIPHFKISIHLRSFHIYRFARWRYVYIYIYICEMGKRKDHLLKPFKNLVKPILFQHFRFNRWMEGRGGWQKLNSIGVYVYIWASVYIGLCLCVHICILIAGFFIICICEIGLFLFSKAITNTKYCLHTVHKNTVQTNLGPITVHKNTVQTNLGPMQLQLPGPVYPPLGYL